MGMICGIFPPSNWGIKTEGKLKDDGRELLELIIGYWDDYDSGDMTCYMLKEHYDGILNGSIHIKKHPYAVVEILELFIDNNKIQPIIRGYNIVF